MKNKYLIYHLLIGLISLSLISGCNEREIEDLEEVSFPTTGEVFIDGFTGDLQYSAFGGSDVTAFDIETQETYNGSPQSMRFAVPDEGSASGAFAGGVFYSTTGRDLSGFNALTFYIKATESVNIGELGFGNDLGENKYVVTLPNLAVNSNWQRVVIPIPDPNKLVGETGLLYYSAGPQDGKGFTFWIDEVKFENLADLGVVKGSISLGEEQVIDGAETGEKISLNDPDVEEMTTQTRAILPNGITQTVSASPYYFTFTSSNPAVAGVNEEGLVSIIDAGTTTITAELNGQEALGSVQITSIGEPVAPTTIAPVPPEREPGDVISLYSNAYTNVPVDTWNARYEFSTVDEFFIQVEGDDIIRYRDLNFVGIEFRTPTVDASSMATLHMDIWTPDPINSGTEFKVLLADLGPEGQFGGDNDVNSEIIVGNSTNLQSEQWVHLEIPLSDFTGLTSRANLGQMVLSGNLPNIYMDNVYFSRAQVAPTTAAPTPTANAADVLSIFSAPTYTDVTGTNFDPNWGQATDAQQVSIAGNNTLHYASFNYQGIDIAGLGNDIDVSTYQSLKIDYYSVNTTVLRVFLIDQAGSETSYNMSVPTTGWNTATIPLSEFAGVNLSQIKEMKFDDSGVGESGDVFLDNIYFVKSAVIPTVAAPTPTADPADVISIFSAPTYTDITGVDYDPNWGQATDAQQVNIAGNNTLHHAGLNYQGIDFAGNPQDVSTYDALHLNYYSANLTVLRVSIISEPGTSPQEAAYNLTVPTAGWNTVTIPLSEFTNANGSLNLSSIGQLKFDNGAPNADEFGDVFIDNIYFVRGGTCPPPPAGDFIVDGDFEANADCWELFAFQAGTSTTIVTNESNGGGTNSARIETAQGGNPGIKQTRFGVGTILPNTTYRVTFDIRADAADPVANGSVLNAFAFSEPAEGSPAGAVQHTLVGGDPNVPATWNTRSYTFTTAANVDGGLSLLIELIGGGPTTTGTVFIDNVSLTIE